MPSSPPLLQTNVDTSAFCNETFRVNCDEGYCRCPHVLTVRQGSVVEVVLVDESMWYDYGLPLSLFLSFFFLLSLRVLFLLVFLLGFYVFLKVFIAIHCFSLSFQRFIVTFFPPLYFNVSFSIQRFLFLYFNVFLSL